MNTAGVRATRFLVAKHGHRDDECEDALCVLADTAGVVAAVSDGASESLLARAWAGLLADAAARDTLRDPAVVADRGAFARFTEGAVAEWSVVVDKYVADRAERGRPVQWYEQPGLAKGAFATLLAVRADAGPDPRDGRRWSAAALGDSCLFHIRDRALIGSFPVDAAEDFDSSPELLCSRGTDTALIAERVRFAAGTALPGDRLLLATDALAAWLLGADAATVTAWLRVVETYENEDSAGAFARLIGNERATGALRNDDVALVVLHFAEPP